MQICWCQNTNNRCTQIYSHYRWWILIGSLVYSLQVVFFISKITTLEISQSRAYMKINISSISTNRSVWRWYNFFKFILVAEDVLLLIIKKIEQVLALQILITLKVFFSKMYLPEIITHYQKSNPILKMCFFYKIQFSLADYPKISYLL